MSIIFTINASQHVYRGYCSESQINPQADGYPVGPHGGFDHKFQAHNVAYARTR